EQQRPVGLVGAGRPYFLAVDNPLVTLAVGAGNRGRQIGAAARFREQLTPCILAGENAAEESLLVQVSAVSEDCCRNEGTDARPGDVDRSDRGEFFVDEGVEGARKMPS